VIPKSRAISLILCYLGRSRGAEQHGSGADGLGVDMPTPWPHASSAICTQAVKTLRSSVTFLLLVHAHGLRDVLYQSNFPYVIPRT
jgi:hypothetical protein